MKNKKHQETNPSSILIIALFIMFLGIAYLFGKSQNITLGLNSPTLPEDLPSLVQSPPSPSGVPTITTTPTPTVDPTIIYKYIYRPTIVVQNPQQDQEASGLEEECKSKATSAAVQFGIAAQGIGKNPFNPSVYESYAEIYLDPYRVYLGSEVFWKAYNDCLKGN